MQLAQGAFAEAQVNLEKALAAQPDNRHARFLRGLCLQARGRNQEALPDFENLTSTPGDFATEAAIQAANIHLAANAPDKARRALDPLARAGGKSGSFLAMQGRVALATGDDEGAFQSFDTAVRTDPAYAGAYLERGLLHIRREALGPGLADLDQYLKLVGDRGAGTRVEEVRGLAEQLRQAAQGAPPGAVVAKEGGA
jgi:tetratricopeptide (TPR) repeat protein